MSKKSQLGTFAVLLLVAISILILDKLSLLGPVKRPVEAAFAPLADFTNTVSLFFADKFTFLTSIPQKDSTIKRLEEERQTLYSQVGELAKLREENATLKEQLSVSSFASRIKEPLVAHIIGRAHGLILDKGKTDGIKTSDIVVVKNIVLGRVLDVSEKISRVLLVSDARSSIQAKAVRTGATGVVKGSLDAIVFANVTLDTVLEVGDVVVTSGDVIDENVGYPPGLIIGKIVSVDKSESNLFQRAKLESPLNLGKIQTVFVIKLVR